MVAQAAAAQTIIPGKGGTAITETLDSALKERLRAVVQDEPATEAELRKLAEEGRACELILGGQLQRSEQRLEALASDPTQLDRRDRGSVARGERAPAGPRRAGGASRRSCRRRAREFRARWVVRP